MTAVICPTCGCSLLRLQVSRDQAVRVTHAGSDHYCCCAGCADRFRAEPERHLAQIQEVVVCPACLGEKPVSMTVTIEHAGGTVHFCGCPGCEEAFARDPERLLARLRNW